MLLDGAQLALGGQAADVGGDFLVVAGAVAQGAGFLRQPFHEVVVDGGFHVDAFHAAAALAGVLVAGPGGAVGGALQVGVGEHDHGVVAAQFQGHRRQRLRRLSHQGLAGGHAAGEEQFVDAVFEEGGGHLGAGADDVLEQPLRQFAGVQDAFDGAAHRRGGGGHFEQHRVAGHQRHDDFTERDRQRVVPGADDAHHAQRQVAHFGALVGEQQVAGGAFLRAEHLAGVFGVPIARQGTGQHFRGQGVDAGLAVAVTDGGGQVLGAVDDIAAHQLDMAGPFLERLGRPLALGGAGPLHALGHAGEIGFIELGHGGAGGGVDIGDGHLVAPAMDDKTGG